MSSIYDLTSHPHHSSSPRRSVHWNEQSMISSKEEIDHLNSHGKKSGRHILLNASLPFYSKLNIRIRTRRDENNENDHVTATAKIERIDPRRDHKHIDSLRNAHFHHYSTLSSNESRRTDSSILDKRLPTHHQVSLPADLPINQQLVLYINNGEVYARC
ncbi:hypothetical protein I4U23_013171 [Adineta vaga]|nr:hypothetical protein I4U23_013171 [Adineta vaga]